MDCYKFVFMSLLIVLYLPYCFMVISTTMTAHYPRECRRPLPKVVNIIDCCPAAMVFAGDYTSSCQILIKNKEPSESSMCEYHKCFFELLGNNVLDDGGFVNKGELSYVLTRWAEVNKKYDAAIHLAKRKCFQDNLVGVSKECLYTNVVFCLVASVVMKCPDWTDSLICTQFKGSLELCEQLYYERLMEYVHNSTKWEPSDQTPLKGIDSDDSEPEPSSASSVRPLFSQESAESQDRTKLFDVSSQNWRKEFSGSDESEESADPVIFI